MAALLPAAAAAGVDSTELARRGAEAFMRQVLEHGLFHADLHHGNLFVTRDGRIAYLDFGISGDSSAPQRHACAELLAALVDRDAARTISCSAPFGVAIAPGHESAMLRGLEELLDRSMRPQTGDVRLFGLGFMRLLGRHGVTIPTGYALLVKSLVTVEGVARELSPGIDMLGVAAPFVTRLLAPYLLSPERLAGAAVGAVGAAARQLVAAGGPGRVH